VVKNTVYDGEYAESQNEWSQLQVRRVCVVPLAATRSR